MYKSLFRRYKEFLVLDSKLKQFYGELDPFVINYLYILECSKSLKPFSCLLRPFHVYKFTCVLIGLNNKQ